MWEVNTVHGSSWHRTDTARKFRVRRRARRNQSPTVVLSGSIRSWRVCGGEGSGEGRKRRNKGSITWGATGRKGAEKRGRQAPGRDRIRKGTGGKGWAGWAVASAG